MRFSIRSMLWLTLVMALLTAWAIDRKRLVATVLEKEQRQREALQDADRHAVDADGHKERFDLLWQRNRRLERETKWFADENKRLETENRQLRISQPAIGK